MGPWWWELPHISEDKEAKNGGCWCLAESLWNFLTDTLKAKKQRSEFLMFLDPTKLSISSEKKTRVYATLLPSSAPDWDHLPLDSAPQSLVEIVYPWILSLRPLLRQEPCLRHRPSWYRVFCWARVPDASAGTAISVLPTSLSSYFIEAGLGVLLAYKNPRFFASHSVLTQSLCLSCLLDWILSLFLQIRTGISPQPPDQATMFSRIWLLLSSLWLFLGRHEQLCIHPS